MSTPFTEGAAAMWIERLLTEPPQLHELTRDEASTLLSLFLKSNQEGMNDLVALMGLGGVALAFTTDSVAGVFERVGAELKFQHVPFDASVPSWISTLPKHAKGKVAFSSASEVWIMRAAFYLGQCFINQYQQLRWASGDVDAATANMPVVTGFLHQKEMPVLMVARNVFMRTVCDHEPWSVVSGVVATWKKFTSSDS